MINITDILRIQDLEKDKAVQAHLVSSLTLTLIRTAWLIFSLFTTLVLVYNEYDSPIEHFLYLTNLNFYGLTGYLLVSSYFSWRSVINPHYLPWTNLHWIFKFSYYVWYQALLNINIIVTTIFWTLYAKNQLNSDLTRLKIYSSIASHLINFFICGCEIIFGGNPVVLTHFPIIATIILLYVPYSMVLFKFTGHWPYYFFDLSKHPLLFWEMVVGNFVGSIIIHYILYKVHQWRDNRNESNLCSETIVSCEDDESISSRISVNFNSV